MSEPAGGLEVSMQELERIVRALEDGASGMDEALVLYERGVALVRQCQGRLREAELRIVALTGAEGDEPVCEPFAHEATAGNGAKRPKRGRAS